MTQSLSSNPASFATVHELLQGRAGETPDAIAVAGLGTAPLTYRDLFDHVVRVAGELSRQGAGRDDRVAIVLPNGPEMATAFLAVSSCAASAPLNPGYRAEEFDNCLSALKAKALIVDSATDSPAAEVACARSIPVLEIRTGESAPAGVFTIGDDGAFRGAEPEFSAPNDVALVLQTSGTTSRPKVVPLTQTNICTSARNVAASLELTAADRCLNVMPLFHIHGLIASLLSSLWAGGSVVCTPGFEAPRFLDWLKERQPTWYTAVPTMHQSILARAEDSPGLAGSSGLRLIRSSSAALPPRVMQRLEEVFSAPVIEAYGMTEAAHQMASNRLPPGERRAGTVGVAAGPEIAILDQGGALLPPGEVGEVAIRGPNVTPGYEDNEEANAAAFSNGWFRTGDQGVLDSSGCLTITGRLKEIVNRGGEKISPREVDEVILDHPAVAQAVTFAIPDPKLGETVGAAVVLDAAGAATEKEIRAFAASRLADFKVPARVVFVDAIPKGPTGKLQRIGLAGVLGIESPAEAGTHPRPPYVPPETAVEKVLADTWTDVLRVDRVGVHDDFLDLGGDSILAARLVARVREDLDVELTVASFFEAGTVRGQAAVIENLLLGQSGRE